MFKSTKTNKAEIKITKKQREIEIKGPAIDEKNKKWLIQKQGKKERLCIMG